MMNATCLVYSSSHAIGIERRLKTEGIDCKLSLIPRGLSSDCGLCVRFDEKDLEAVQQLVTMFPFEIQEITLRAE